MTTARIFALCHTPCAMCSAAPPTVSEVAAAETRLPASIEHFGDPRATRSVCADCIRGLVAAAAHRVQAVHG